jgi:perosamine synthetase
MTLLSGPNIAGNEWKYVKDCLDTGWVSSVGSYVTKFEQMMAEFVGTKYAVATSCGTTALHISMQIAGVKRRDYVIVPNITFIASVNAIKYTGADPILMDIDPESWQMDLNLLEKFLENDCDLVGGKLILKKNKRRISAIMPVHVLGNMGDMPRLMQISAKYCLKVIEDSTEALGSYWNGRHAGTWGEMNAFSFNGNKIITTGGGGMIVTDDEKCAKMAKHLTTQAKSDPMEYMHDHVGYNYRLVNILAAMGCAQMELLPGFVARKKEIDAFYKQHLGQIEGIKFQKIHENCDPNSWLFTFQHPKMRELLTTLNAVQLQSRPFWVPMNQLVMFKKDIYISNNDRAGAVYSTCLSIPCSTDISDEKLAEVVEVIKNKLATI